MDHLTAACPGRSGARQRDPGTDTEGDHRPDYLLRWGRGDAALRGARKRCVPFPVLKVSCLQHATQQPEEPVIADFLRQDPAHYFIIQRSEAVGDVSFHEPGCPRPVDCHLSMISVAAAAGSETVRAAGKLRLGIRLKEQADHFADQLVRPGRQAERPELPVLLLDIDTPHRGTTEPLTA